MSLGLTIGLVFFFLIGGSAYLFFLKSIAEYQESESEITEIIYYEDACPNDKNVHYVEISCPAEGFNYVSEIFEDKMILSKCEQGKVIFDVKYALNTFRFLSHTQYGPTIPPMLELTIPREGKTKAVAPDKIKTNIENCPWGGWLVIKLPEEKGGKIEIVLHGNQEECVNKSLPIDGLHAIHVKDALRLFEIVREPILKT